MRGAWIAILVTAGCADPRMIPLPSPAVQSGDVMVPWQPADPLDQDDAPGDGCEAAADFETTVYVSSDDSASAAEPVRVRQAIREGSGVAGPVRTWEFLNYYGFDYEPAEPGELRIVPELRAREDGDGYSLLVSVVAPAVAPADRRASSLTFSIDSSGSMAGLSIQRARAVVESIAGELRQGDVVSVVTWAARWNTLLAARPVEGPNDPELLRAARALVARGSTDLESGLRAAYDAATESWSPDRTNRVILVSDGGANTGVTDEEIIALHADDAEAEGTYLVGIGTANAAASYDDRLMNTVTDLGKGAYLYVDSEREARAALTGERFVSVVQLAARDVRLSITLPSSWAIGEFHGEQASGSPREVEPQHLAPNDAMLHHLLLRSCAPGRPEREDVVFRVEWADPRWGEPREQALTVTIGELLAGESRHVRKADALVAYATAIADSRDDPAAAERLAGALGDVEDAISSIGPDPDLEEVRGLLQEYLSML